MKLRTLLVFLLAFALLWLFIRGIDMGEVWRHVRSADPGLITLALVFVALTYVTRAVRWQYLLVPLGGARFSTALRSTLIGFAALSLLPARVGDPLRSFLLARDEGLSQPGTFATVIAERVLDLMAVLVLLAVYVWGFADPTTIPAEAFTPIKLTALGFGAATVALLVSMWVLAAHPERIGSLVLAATRVLSRRNAERLARFATRLSSGFAVARSPRLFALSIVWSFPIWLAIAAEVWAATRAFGLSLTYPGSFLVQTLLVIGVAVPTPAGVGSYHYAYRYGMTRFFGAQENEAAAAALVLHVVSFAPVVLVGVVLMVRDGLSLGRVHELTDQAGEKELPEPDEVSILRKSGR